MEERSEGERILLEDDGAIHACARIVRLPWDSRFFEFPVARLEGLFFRRGKDAYQDRVHMVTKSLGTNAGKSARLIICRVRADDPDLILALEDNDFRLADVLAIYSKHIKVDKKKQHHTLTDSADSALHQLVEECIKSMRHGRLFADPLITDDLAGRFYASVTGYYIEKGATVTVLKIGNTPAGVAVGIMDEKISREINQKYGYLWLIALKPQLLGKGLGSELFKKFCSQFGSICDTVEIGVQVANLPATRVYLKSGCRLEGHLMTFHRWQSKILP